MLSSLIQCAVSVGLELIKKSNDLLINKVILYFIILNNNTCLFIMYIDTNSISALQ